MARVLFIKEGRENEAMLDGASTCGWDVNVQYTDPARRRGVHTPQACKREKEEEAGASPWPPYRFVPFGVGGLEKYGPGEMCMYLVS